MQRKMLFSIVFTLLLVGCGDGGPTTPPTPSMTGSWRGSTSDLTVNFTSTENAGSVNGSGTVSGSGFSIAVTITGTHAHPNVSLTARASGYEDMNYSGAFSGDNTINGTLNGSGFNNYALTLQRQ